MFTSTFKQRASMAALTISILASTSFLAAPAQASWGLFDISPRTDRGSNFGGFDGGGRVADYLGEVMSANETGEAVTISGTCASACTMKLGIRNACVYSSATLLFHAAHNNGRMNSLGTRIMLRQYPSAIRAWVVSHAALASTDLTEMSGAQAISLGVRDCETGSHATTSAGLEQGARPSLGHGYRRHASLRHHRHHNHRRYAHLRTTRWM